ncbi:MAG: hypothetical protein IKL80_04240 [Clostridia bacterium]|nr:hypothetical protein [Clostridia bacterium]
MSVVIMLSLQGVVRKGYVNRVGGKGSCLFNAVACLVAAVFFFISGKMQFAWERGVLAYAIGFGLTYGMTIYFGLRALLVGPMSLTSLATSYSLMIPTFYGLLFQQEPAGFWLFLGLGFLALSLLFITLKKDEKQISFRWGIYAFLAFAGNGLCSTIQRVQQFDFAGAYKNEFMTVALLLIAVFLFAVAYRNERADIGLCLKKGIGGMIFWGVINGMTNLIVMILATRVAASLMFPLISAGSIVLTWILARFLYKEKLTALQNTGLVLGILAVVFLNL